METKDAPREAYEPPAIEDLPLVPEETVLAGCKTGSNSTGSSFQNHLCANCRTLSAS